MNCNKNTQNVYINQNGTTFYCDSSSNSRVNDASVVSNHSTNHEF